MFKINRNERNKGLKKSFDILIYYSKKVMKRKREQSINFVCSSSLLLTPFACDNYTSRQII